MAQRVLKPPHCLVQMEAHFSLINILSWKGGKADRSVLNRPSTDNDNAINRHTQMGFNVLLDEFLIFMEHGQRFNISFGKGSSAGAIQDL